MSEKPCGAYFFAFFENFFVPILTSGGLAAVSSSAFAALYSAFGKYDVVHIHQAYFSAEEMYRNAYEDACAKYLDKKIDVERFEKMYKQEIYKLVNDPQQKEFYATNQTTYASTVAVYKNWFSQS